MNRVIPSVRVAIFNPIFAHYRQALLRELANIAELDVHLFADTVSGELNIPAIDLVGDSRFRRTRCTRILRATWQDGALREAATGDYDVYIFTGDASWLSTWLAAAVARARGRRVLFWTHGWTRQDRGLKRFVRVSFYRLASALLLYGHHGKRVGVSLGFDERRLHVVYNSLDFERQQTLRAQIAEAEIDGIRHELFGAGNEPVVLAVARLTSVKRFDFLIRACALARRTRPNLHLLIVGDGPERPNLESLAAQCAISVAFAGDCYDEATLARFFASANVTVSPGNVGLTCMHSMGYGVPVVTHDDPEHQMPEWEAIVSGVTGTLVSKDNIEALAAAILEWTGTPHVTERTREECLKAIRERYHPKIQARLLHDAIVARDTSNAPTPSDELTSVR